MSRFLLSAAAVCALCVSISGSADAGSTIKQNFMTSNGIAVKQKFHQSGHGTSQQFQQQIVMPNGTVYQSKSHQNSHHSKVQTKVKYPNGSSYKTQYRW